MVKNRGFSLIELLVAIAVVGILLAIALPNYQSYVLRGRIQEATTFLADARIKMEQYYQDNRSYTGATIGTAGTTLNTTGTKYFTYALVIPDGANYSITATGKASQSMTGYSYAINQANAKSSTVPGSVGATCWLLKKGDSC